MTLGRRFGCALVALGLIRALPACGEKEAPATRETASELPKAVSREPLEPLPSAARPEPKLVALGRRLFHEPRLSADGTVACSTCHNLAKGGVDGRVLSAGVNGKLGVVNAPTVYNAALNFVQFWDGRAATLEEQLGFPLTNAAEMGTTWQRVLGVLTTDPTYRAQFQAAFADGVTEPNVRHAIAEFERTLLTRGAPFDRFLEGDTRALSPEARHGYETFKSVGCIACHQGRNVGGNMFQRFGVLGDYFKDRGHVTAADYGRYNVTHNEADRYVFRVPSLRNVERTAPYFHDGSATTLKQAVQVMARYQLGRKLADEQVTSIIAFLGSLSGELAPAGEKG